LHGPHRFRCASREHTWAITSGREDFERGHIPGAQFVDVVTELSDPADPVPCMAPSAVEFATVMCRLGVGNRSRVVLYSTQNAYWAARVWWLLRLFGFDSAALLNGGWQKWRREGRPIESGPARPRRRSRFVVREQRPLVATKAEVLAAIGDSSVCTINPRGSSPSCRATAREASFPKTLGRTGHDG
jgi:thiosulfate/3-mercaptopyruvate sulfurtransferase